jgi:hypothetical protein
VGLSWNPKGGWRRGQLSSVIASSARMSIASEGDVVSIYLSGGVRIRAA